jgi:hypothetical protein
MPYREIIKTLQQILDLLDERPVYRPILVVGDSLVLSQIDS